MSKPKTRKKLIAWNFPPDHKEEILQYMRGIKLTLEVVGEGSWLALFSITDPSWAAENFKGTPKQNESKAKVYGAAMVIRQMEELGAVPVYKTVKSRSKTPKERV